MTSLADGFYMLALSKGKPGIIRGYPGHILHRLAMIFGSGLLVYTAGRIEALTGSIPLSWTVVIGASGFCIRSCAAVSHIRASFSCYGH